MSLSFVCLCVLCLWRLAAVLRQYPAGVVVQQPATAVAGGSPRIAYSYYAQPRAAASHYTYSSYMPQYNYTYGSSQRPPLAAHVLHAK